MQHNAITLRSKERVDLVYQELGLLLGYNLVNGREANARPPCSAHQRAPTR